MLTLGLVWLALTVGFWLGAWRTVRWLDAERDARAERTWRAVKAEIEREATLLRQAETRLLARGPRFDMPFQDMVTEVRGLARHLVVVPIQQKPVA